MPTHHPVLNELVAAGHMTTVQAAALLDEHRSSGRPIRDLAVEQACLTEPDYLAAVARLLDTEVVDLSAHPISPAIGNTVPAALARMYAAVPVRLDGEAMVFAVADWPSPAATDDLAFVLSRPVRYVMAAQAEVEGTLQRLYGSSGSSIREMLAELKSDLEDTAAPDGPGAADLEDAARSTPVIRFVNLVLFQAVKDRASDIHFEPFEHEFRIRCRVDGVLYEMEPPPARLALPVISRVKVIAGLDIAESRLPQDGRIQLKVAGRSIDFRVSTLPTRFGESVVLRVLDRSNVQLELDQLGLPEDVRDRFSEDIRRPNGIVIVTGPTGSGKTTTLYAALQQINRPETKILTAEDPVEYDIEGISQLPICENIGLTFAAALRAFLRQDPDVIMVGEIRDPETAQIAVQAALTGHLVFSTLHTSDAPGAVTRLIDMEVEPYLIASTLEAVMAQRLVRTICPDCRQAGRPDPELLCRLDLSPARTGSRPFYHGSGCESCGHTGYRGRRAIFEYLRMNEALRGTVMERRPSLVLRNKAMELGMRTLREDGIRCILDGFTTLEEVVQYI